MPMLQRGDLVPHFELTTVDGRRIRYADQWQRRNLVLITLPDSDSDFSRRYVSELNERIPQFRARNTECLVTREQVAGIPHPGALVADRWGEVVDIRPSPALTDLPSPDELLDWIDYVQVRCPECEGEVR